MFNDFAVAVDAENIHQRGAAVLRIILAEHMQRHQIALGYHLFDLTAPLRVGLQNFGKGIDKRLRAIAFDAEQARLLQLREGSPGLFIERRAFLDDGRVVEFTRSYYRGDAYDFVAELQAPA